MNARGWLVRALALATVVGSVLVGCGGGVGSGGTGIASGVTDGTVNGYGSVIVDGSAPIRDVNRAMDWSLPDDRATTIAGLVIQEARVIPDAGQVFTFHGLRFAVLRKHRNRITALRITPLPAAAAQADPAEPR